ncbi:hypothetical protein GCM10022399_37870 [Terrabacter ginsenosidimutans]|uniref:Uncharacterized protein n=1 Tax=Terrabacter ginsenosidimutans TaxID=490575 RepID=A0ABP7EDH5_9MICO
MLLPGTTGWTDTISVFLTATALVVLPGLAAGLLLRLRPLAALGLAPVLSTTCLSVSAAVASLLGVRWGVGPLLLGTVVMGAVAAGVGALVPRVAASLSARGGWWGRWQERAPGPRFDSVWWSTVASVVLVLVIVLVTIRTELRTPEVLPQGPDTIFHVAAPQWGLENGTLSSFEIGRFNSPTWSGFYPAAFYAFTGTISLLSGASVVVSSSVFVVVLVGVVWPLGCILLALALLGRRVVVVLSAALLSVAFTTFPYLLMGFGVLWPNLLGQAILPAALAALAGVFRPLGRPRYAVADPLRSLLVLVAAVPGVVMAHPNAFVTLCLCGGLLVLGRVIGLAVRQPSWPRRAAVLAAALLAVTAAAAASVAVRSASMFATGAAGPEREPGPALEDLLGFAPRHTRPLHVLAVVVGIGVVVLLWRHRGARWVVPALVTTLALFWLNIAVDSDVVRWFTWPWYNNAVRLHTAAILPAVLAATAGLVAVADLVAHAATRRWGATRGVALGACVALGILVLDAGTQLGAHRHILHRYFHPQPADSWASAAELRSLNELATRLPPKAVVAANPWNGGTYLYVVSGRKLLVPTEKTNTPGDRQLLAASLDRVDTDPQVCAAAMRQQVTYAITGGQPFSWAGNRVEQYAGIDDVGSSPGWRRVAAAAPYTLYERVGCAD